MSRPAPKPDTPPRPPPAVFQVAEALARTIVAREVRRRETQGR